jgi:hypothetical protein
MAMETKLVNKLCGMPMAILTFIDENGQIFGMPIKDFTVTTEYIELKKPMSLHHKFGQNQKVGVCWSNFTINEKTGKLDIFEHVTLWGTANEMGQGLIRIIPAPKFHAQTTEETFDPSAAQALLDKAKQFRKEHGLANAFESKGVI